MGGREHRAASKENPMSAPGEMWDFLLHLEISIRKRWLRSFLLIGIVVFISGCAASLVNHHSTPESEKAQLTSESRRALGIFFMNAYPFSPEGFKINHKKSVAVGAISRNIGNGKVGFNFPLIADRQFGLNFEHFLQRVDFGEYGHLLLEGGTLSIKNVNGSISVYPVLNKDLMPFIDIGFGVYKVKKKELNVTIDNASLNCLINLQKTF